MEKLKPAQKLNIKQEMLCREYLIDLNASQAAIRAGYSAKNADVTGPKMLGNVGIAEYIQQLMTQRAEKVGTTAQSVIEEIAKMAFTDMADYIRRARGLPKNSENIGTRPEHYICMEPITAIQTGVYR